MEAARIIGPTAPAAMMNVLAGDPIDRLPKVAKARLTALRELADDRRGALEHAMTAYQEAVTARQWAQNRVNELRGGPYEPPKCDDSHPSMVDALARLARANEEFARVSERQDARAHRWQAVSGPKTAAEDYIHSLGSSVPIIVFNGGSSAKPQNGETIIEAVERLQNKVREIKANLHSVRSAPRSAAHAKAAFRAEIERLAEMGKPDVFGMIEYGEPIKWPTQSQHLTVHGFASIEGRPEVLADSHVTLTNNWAVEAWLRPDALIAKVDAMIDAAADEENALSDAERASRSSFYPGSCSTPSAPSAT